MKRRITTLSAASLVDALFTLAPQPFDRLLRLVTTDRTAAGATTSLAQCATISGEILWQSVGFPSTAATRTIETYSFNFQPNILFAFGGSPSAGGISILSASLPFATIPANCVFTLQLFGTAGGDTVSKAVVTTEDDYPLDWPE